MTERQLPILKVPKKDDGSIDVEDILARGKRLADKMPGMDYEEWETVRLLIHVIGSREGLKAADNLIRSNVDSSSYEATD